jgi:hypothetical protein
MIGGMETAYEFRKGVFKMLYFEPNVPPTDPNPDEPHIPGPDPDPAPPEIIDPPVETPMWT